MSSNKQYEFELKFNPKDLNTNGQEVQFKVEAQCNPKAKEWEGQFEVNSGGFALGPVLPWTNIEFKTNNKGEKFLEYAQNLQIEKDYHLGWKLVGDLGQQKLKSAYGLLGANLGNHGFWYFRSNCLTRLCAVGCHYSAFGGKGHHSTEVQYDLTQKEAGLRGLPLWWRFGADYTFGNGIKTNYQLDFGQALLWRMRTDLPMPWGKVSTTFE